MICSRKDFIAHLDADRKALGVSVRHPLLATSNSMVWLTDPVYRWERLLRKCEYWENCRPGVLAAPYRIWLRWRFQRLSSRLGISIPLNVCGPGLCILHYGSIVVSRHASIGEGCVINSCVNVGANRGGAPRIGKDVYLGPGAKLFGPIKVADGVRVGANAVVCKDCTTPGETLVGVPAHKSSLGRR